MSKEASEKYGPHIVQYSMDYSLCSGCTFCEIICALTHDGSIGPQLNRIFVEKRRRSMIHRILSCQHCSDHPCYEKCPKKNQAMCLDENNIAYINEENCIGCGSCMRACKFEPSRINLIKSKDKSERKAKKCDLCRTRHEGPACIEWCSVQCLGRSDEAVRIKVDIEKAESSNSHF
jgi:Fe-S-cluster-containing hydrogenase component 2